jgi:hypothetical protein
LEESSAERIIRDFLIPWFAPKLSRIRTLSANGADKVTPAFEEFRRLFLFAHLGPVYRDRAWVRLDGDKVGNGVVERLRATYKEIEAGHFATFPESQFERYYPDVFKQQVEQALSVQGDQAKREAKKALFLAVKAWLDEDHARGKRALARSAREVIEDLRSIHKSLFGVLPDLTD